MRRNELIRHWQDELLLNEQNQLVYGTRYRWLYQSRARFYRLLLHMYGETPEQAPDEGVGEDDVDQEVPAQLSPACLESPETLSGRPTKDLGAIRKVLKSVTAANDGFPAGSYSRRDVEHAWIIVASGTRLRSPALYQVALEQHRIAYQFDWEGAQWAIRTRFADKDRAQEIFSTIRENQRPRVPFLRIAALESGLPDWKPHLPLLVVIGGVAVILLLIVFAHDLAAQRRSNQLATVILNWDRSFAQMDQNLASLVLLAIGFTILSGVWYWTHRMSPNKITKT